MGDMETREGHKAEQMLETENLSEVTQNTASMLQDRAPTRTNPNQQQPGRRVRMCSESEVWSQVGRRQRAEYEQAQAHADQDQARNVQGYGAPFRGRSQSAPAALLAAKRYGRRLRRMSDEFDTWLDRGEPKRGSASTGQQAARGWFSFLWSSKEAEGRE